MRAIDGDRLLRELTVLSHGQVWPGWTYEGIRLLIERQPILTPPNEWIRVDDRLPEYEKPVLAYYGFYRDGGDLGARFIGTLTYFCFDTKPHWQHESTGLFVTHWMPLPAPTDRRPPEGET